MAKTWYTRPPHQFDSFYYFDEGTRKLVRIRLELHRTSDDNDTKAILKDHRYFGFSSSKLDAKDTSKWTVEKGKIKYNGVELTTDPTEGYRVYDFTLKPEKTHPEVIHSGNTCTTNGDRPPGISEDDLIDLAKLAIKEGEGIFLTDKNATPEQLSHAILTKIGKLKLA